VEGRSRGCIGSNIWYFLVAVEKDEDDSRCQERRWKPGPPDYEN
jgi:hypothetical protein